MSYPVNILPRAQQDLHECFDWIAAFSEDAALRWYQAFLHGLARVSHGPLNYALIPEASRLRAPVRVFVFSTNPRRKYQGVFIVTDDEVQVLRVRGPGQAPLRADELGISIPD